MSNNFFASKKGAISTQSKLVEYTTVRVHCSNTLELALLCPTFQFQGAKIKILLNFKVPKGCKRESSTHQNYFHFAKSSIFLKIGYAIASNPLNLALGEDLKCNE